MQAGICNSLSCSLRLWGSGHIKVQAPGLIFHETRWLWRRFYQQDTALYSRCRAAQKINFGQSAWVTNMPALLVFCSVLMSRFIIKIKKSMTETFQLLTEAYVEDCVSRLLVFEWHRWFSDGREVWRMMTTQVIKAHQLPLTSLKKCEMRFKKTIGWVFEQ